MNDQYTESTLRRVLAESGRGSVSTMMRFLKHQHKGKYDPKTAMRVAEDLVRDMPKY